MSAIPAQPQGNGLPTQPSAAVAATAPAAAAPVEADPATTEEEQPGADGTTADATAVAPAANANAGADDEQRPIMDIPSLPEPKLPTRKDVSLKELLTKMDEYAPIIPDAVTAYYMTRAGLPPPPQTDQRLARLLALATQKFIADIAADAYQYSRIRASNTNANNPMGSLGAAAGFPIPGQPTNQAAGAKDQGRGGPLGIQRPGYGGGGQGGSQNRTVLTMEDLGMAAGEFGVNVKRSEFYR
ncbi:transcription initiation factor TFIID 23-30kDa subunit-domain-containing protein [Pseudoneurospora amorphoporcata]|uniref:Transcription initiation factor TFIID subunit 10 n=1 Tax=Pseudoneurospora amorphoporcata TaxID=241081 RepID=A0AAN6SFA4_9PEZI|nr:transcription initiation factor TFIID 23-30kDa subunit-domain-containing protein [Pseudoneurospora amorphoporcata]